MANIKKLERASKIFDQIKELDSQIIEIEGWANKIADGGYNIGISISFDKINKDEKVQFDSDGSIISGTFGSGGYIGYNPFTTLLESFSGHRKQEADTIKKSINESDGLIVLGALLSNLVYKRDNLINELKNIGIEL